MTGPIRDVSLSHKVPVPGEAGVEIHIAERAAPKGGGGTPILFVHGATLPGTVIFDLDIPGYSWLARAAADGHPAFALDVRGYGGSTRPEVMAVPAVENPPFARAETVVADIDAAVTFIRARTGARKIHLVGHSWGTVTGGQYAIRHGDKLDRLVLFAPVYSDRHQGWLEMLAESSDPGRIRADIGSYRVTTREMLIERWQAQLTGGGIEAMLDRSVLDRFLDAALNSDPACQSGAIPGLRSPNGVLVDLFEIFSERPVYEAGAITLPTLVIRGSEDTDSTRTDALGLFDRLGSAVKRYVEIAAASHFVLLERNAPALHDLVANFLSEDAV